MSVKQRAISYFNFQYSFLKYENHMWLQSVNGNITCIGLYSLDYHTLYQWVVYCYRYAAIGPASNIYEVCEENNPSVHQDYGKSYFICLQYMY